jgi:hypothetical protein
MNEPANKAVLTITAHEELLQGSRQKPRLLPRILRSQHSHIPVQHLLPAATKLLSEKSAAGDFFPMD